MPYIFAAERFHTKKLCSRFSSRKDQFLYGKRKKIAFEAPFGVRATCAVHLRLIGKLIVDFLLVIIELFSLGAFTMHTFDRQTDRCS